MPAGTLWEAVDPGQVTRKYQRSNGVLSRTQHLEPDWGVGSGKLECRGWQAEKVLGVRVLQLCPKGAVLRLGWAISDGQKIGALTRYRTRKQNKRCKRPDDYKCRLPSRKENLDSLRQLQASSQCRDGDICRSPIMLVMAGMRAKGEKGRVKPAWQTTSRYALS